MAHYSGTKCKYDGITFDSITERDYYIKLKNDERVWNLTVHPLFVLQDSFKSSNKTIRKITFKPDFKYTIENQIYIVDIKPNNKKLIDKDFTLRWKMLQYQMRNMNVIFKLVAFDKKTKQFIQL